MKRWFRPVAYSTILVLAALAVFGDEAPADASASAAPQRLRASTRDERLPVLPALRERESGIFPAELFVSDSVPQPPPAPPAEPPPPPAPADIRVLGWMLSDSTPQVFVEWNGNGHTLKPDESIDDTYRFDRIGGGFADFTHLPTGEARQYAVSDPALLE